MNPTTLIRGDHRRHFVVGLAIVVGATAVTALILPQLTAIGAGAYAGWHVARAAGWLKEAYDLQRPVIHTSDPMDAEVTIAGASLGLAMVLFGLVCLAAAGVR